MIINTAKTLYNKEFDFSAEEGKFYKSSENKDKSLYKAQEKCDGRKIIVIPKRKSKIIYFDLKFALNLFEIRRLRRANDKP
jgi:hypothetical protein